MAKIRRKEAESSKPPVLRVYPISLQPRHFLAEDIGEWRVIGHPYSSAGGKTVNVHVESVKPSGVIQIEVRAWAAHERVAVKLGER